MRSATAPTRLLLVLVASLTAFLVHAALASATYPELAFEFGKEGTGNGEFKEPTDIATDSEGNIWVVDTGNNRLQKFNAKGEYLSQFGKQGKGNGEFESPHGIGITSENIIWVVDTGNNRLQKFNTKGEYLGQFGKQGKGEAEFEAPKGIEIDSTDRIWVADTGNNRIQKFNAKAVYLTQFGKEGTGKGEFRSPLDVALDQNEHVWVTDSENDRVQEFGGSFAFLSEYGGKGSKDGKLQYPIGISVDFQGKLWVADSLNNRAQKFTDEDQYQDKFGTEGSGEGQLMKPAGIDAAAPQQVLVVDWGNNRVQSWSVKAEPPRVSFIGPTEITATSATIRAGVDPEWLPTTYFFEYGKTKELGSVIPLTPESVKEGTASVTVSQSLTELEQETQYFYRVVAESSAGATLEEIHSVKTLGLPIATTKAATEITATAATLNGTANAERSEGSYHFEYDTKEYKAGEGAHGTSIPVPDESIGSTGGNIPVSQKITGLAQNTLYHFRLVVTNTLGTTYGADKTLTTLKLPKATTEAATSIKGTAALLNGTVNPEGSATSYYFEYGETESYGSKIPISAESVGSGTSNVPVSQALTGLTNKKTYHYRLVAESVAGTVKGEDKSFESKVPSVGIQLAEMGVTEVFDGSSASVERFGANWSTLGWATGTTPKGSDSSTGWHPVDAYPTLNGTYYNSSVSDTGTGLAGVATMAANPTNASRYFSLWLDVSSPASTRSGYELRFTDVSTNTYKVTLSKWVEGVETELASESSYPFSNGNSFAIVDQGGTVSAWTDTGSGFSQLLSASDSTFEKGNAGIHGAGNITRLTKFKVGQLE